MVIDEVDEQTTKIKPKIEEKKPVLLSGLTTISSLVEKEITKTLNQSEKRLINNNTNNTNISPDKISSSTTSLPPPPPLVTVTKSRSPPIHSHNQQTYPSKGSIMRGTSISPSNKPTSIDISTTHSHPYSNPRNEYSHHSSSSSSSTYHDSPHMKSSKGLDQQQLYLQQQQQAAYMRQYPHNNFPTQYLSPQQQQQQQSHKPSTNNQQQTSSKSHGIDTSNTDTYETLRADFVTSRYLTTTTHSPNHER